MVNLCGRGKNDGKEREMAWGIFLLNLWILRNSSWASFPKLSPSLSGGSHTTFTQVPVMVGS